MNILVVDDEIGIRKTLAVALEAEGHQVVAVSNAQDALGEASRRLFDVALVDLRLGTASGLDLIPELLAQSQWLKIIVITAFASYDTAVEAIKRGAVDYVPKPFTPAQLNLALTKAAEVIKLERKLETLQDSVTRSGPEAELSSANAAMQRVVALARDVATSEATVLLNGESGTGKSVLARAIHGWSHRNTGPFAAVSCPSLSAELLESELFGHVKGAFTGAVKDNVGRVASTAGGTLFLDEIGDLPLSIQPKLLRFLQDREYERVGDTVTRKADVRVISATHVNLDAAVKAGRFREDLLYRLNVVQISLPALRERKEDILPIAQRLIGFFARQNHKQILGFSDEAVTALQEYAWPGNLRELRNVIERAAIFCKSSHVSAEHMPKLLSVQPREPQLGDDLTLEQLEELHIRRLLAKNKSIDRASEILGVDPATLWRRRKKYGI